MKILITLLFLCFFLTSYSQEARGKFSIGGIPTIRFYDPVSNAGTDQAIQLPLSQVNLSGIGSYDYDGTIITYAWVKVSGTGSTITSPTSSTTTVTGLTAGTYQFELTVTDNDGLTDADTVQIIVAAALNVLPVANAGIDKSRTLPTDTATLFGIATDADGTIVSTTWTKTVGSPAGGDIISPTSLTTAIENLQVGIYYYYLTVIDNNGGGAIDYMILTVSQNPATPTGTGKFQWTTDTIVHSSGGVYYHDSTLVKTLWSDSIVSAGTHINYWDGTDDYGNPIVNPDTAYTIKVLTNNVGYEWQGTIGNSSDSMTGINKHRAYYNCLTGIVFASNGYGYYCTGFSEGSTATGRFNQSAPNVNLPYYSLYTGRIVDLNTQYIATDNVNVFYAGFDSYSNNNTMVYARRLSDNAMTSFGVNGLSYKVTNGNVTLTSAISRLNQTNSFISGIAVQKTGSYLFVARSLLNQVQVINRTTGALVQTLTYTTPQTMCVDNSDNLWMVTGTNTVSKYTVNVDGTLTAATLTLSGLLQPLAIAVSTDGTTITVADGSTDQQVKGFSNTTGASSWTLGTAGGYFTDPNVTNSKFYFNDVQGYSHKYRPVFLAYQSDGSFWVGDGGNLRAQHYSSSRTFIDRIMSLSSSYYTWVDRNNINRVFSGNLEFEIDYSVQTLTGSTGWLLKRNWGANITTLYNDFPRYQTTLSNGRTYGIIWNKAISNQNRFEYVEFPPTGQLRFTGVIFDNSAKVLAEDGSRQTYSVSNNIATVKRYPLTGFDGSNNPTWGAAQTIAIAVGDAVLGNPIIRVNNMLSIMYNPTTNKVVFYNPDAWANASKVPFAGYHVRVASSGATNTWIAQTEKSTHKAYLGDYPKAGYSDVGNLVNNYAGGNMSFVDSLLITSYHGEFWKNSQTNKYNLYYLNGLAIGQFGVTRPQAGGYNLAYPGMAGNSLTPIFVKDGDGDLYLYHGDESDHSGVHRWKVTRLNTIAVQSIPIAFPSSYVAPTIDYTDLMGLPFNTTLVTGTNGWTRTPVLNATGGSTNWLVSTSVLTYDFPKNNDIYIKYQQPTALNTHNVSKDLGTINVSNDWKIEGNINWGTNINGGGNNAYIEVLDVNGKLLTTMQAITQTGVRNVRGNSVLVYSNLTGNNYSLYPFYIQIVAGVVTFHYDGSTSAGTTISDGTGDWTKPKTLRIRLQSGVGPNNPVTPVVSGLKLFEDVL